MKKILVFLIILFSFPFIVKAEGYCTVVSGDGKAIGSEIACGNEHFYVIDSNDDKTRLFAKYNLFTGDTIYKEKIEKTTGDTRTDEQYCHDLAESKGGTVKSDQVYYYDPGYCFYALPNINTENKSLPFSKEAEDTRDNDEICKDLISEEENTHFIRYNSSTNMCDYTVFSKKIEQSEEAIGARIDENEKFIFPQIGDVTPYALYSNARFTGPPAEVLSSAINTYGYIDNTNFFDYYYKVLKNPPEETTFNHLAVENLSHGLILNLVSYKEELEKTGLHLETISLLTLSEMNSIISKVSNNSIPFSLWNEEYEALKTNDNGTPLLYMFGQIKDLVPSNYKWLYSTTYWNDSMYSYSIPINDYQSYVGTIPIFTTTLGKICGSGFEYCATTTSLGAGIRPVITINTSDIRFVIKTDTDGHGSIDVIDSSRGDQEISFGVAAEEGYVLGELKIITDSGEEITIVDGELIKNDDGIITIDGSKFTMPYENVTIIASFKSKKILMNPETRDNIIFFIAVLVISSSITITLYKKEKRLRTS